MQAVSKGVENLASMNPAEGLQAFSSLNASPSLLDDKILGKMGDFLDLISQSDL
jgi:hypothetical protein